MSMRRNQTHPVASEKCDEDYRARMGALQKCAEPSCAVSSNWNGQRGPHELELATPNLRTASQHSPNAPAKAF
jgi:hypothetical protein